MNFLYGFISGGVLVFVVYHFGLQPLLQKMRDDNIQKAKDALGKKL